MIGKIVSQFRIVEKLGQGGMGDVYKAEDTKLRRWVALKFLPGEFAQNRQALERFQREAQAASALNHPNICVIHDIQEFEGHPFIVMEYLEGQTLKDRLMRLGRAPASPTQGAGLRTDEILDLGTQIADALDAAHAKGIVHRDIKPANIFVTTRGQAKILDFGLAKLVPTVAPGSAPSASRRMADVAATAHALVTIPGTMLGTVAYMSPEQVRGEELDARTDLFSFGVVLYEMATGRLPFRGATAGAILGAILHSPLVPAATLNADLPAELDRTIGKALEKDREVRCQSAAELRADLKRLKRDTEFSRSAARVEAAGASAMAIPEMTTPAPAEARRQPARRRWLWPALMGAIVIGGMVAIGLLLTERTNKPGGQLKISPFTSTSGQKEGLAFSPDGNELAFAWRSSQDNHSHIYVKLTGTGKALELTTGAGEDSNPAWSPDGRSVAFVRDSPQGSAYYQVAALGGAERKIADAYVAPGSALGGGFDWAQDGKYLVAADKMSPSSSQVSLVSISVEDGQRKTLVTPAGPYVAGPKVSPDGSTIAYFQGKGWLAYDIYFVPFSGGEPKQLTYDNRGIGGIAWMADGKEIVFSSDRSGSRGFWRVAVSGGSPQALAAVGENAGALAVAHQGSRMAYIADRAYYYIWRAAGPKSAGPRAASTSLIASSSANGQPEYSPDGKHIVFMSDRGGTNEIWVSDSDGSNPGQLTSLGASDTGTPHWSPDGKWIAFDSRKEGHGDVYVISSDGGAPRRLTSYSAENNVPTWSRDSKWIYFSSDRTGTWQIWKIPAQGGTEVQVTKQGGFEAFESPDGRLLYILRNDPPHVGLWKMPMHGESETEVVAFSQPDMWEWFFSSAMYPGGFCFLDWSQHPPELEHLDLATNRVTPAGTLEVLNVPKSVYGISISLDGKWLLYSRLDLSESNIMLVDNFR